MSITALLRMLYNDIRDTIFFKKKILRDIRASWARFGSKENYLADHYYNLTRGELPSSYVDDRTWKDLEFPRIFADMDSTITPIGSQVLFKWLHTYTRNNADLADTYKLFEELKKRDSERERIQLKLASLRDTENAHISSLIFGEAPMLTRGRYYLLLLWSLVSLFTLSATIIFSWPIWFWFAIVVVNFVVIRMMSWSLYRDVGTVKACMDMLHIANTLSEGEGKDLYPIQKLVMQTKDRVQAQRALGWLSILRRPIIEEISVWLTVFFLVEFIAYFYFMRRLILLRPVLASTFYNIGYIDAAISITSYLECFPNHCKPDISSRKVFKISNGYHPLISSPVENSISLDGVSALITGSNMAGKTTFIKMLAINHILGHAMGFCLAEQATLSDCGVMTSIRGDHSVESGKSHYFVEIEAIHNFIDSCEQNNPLIYIIDEMFNGTNTQERVAIARAVLEYLCERTIVIVTTHDVELQTTLNDCYQKFYFQEDPDVEGFFDYKLRAGSSDKRNAILLLQRMKYPDLVVSNAMRYAKVSD